MINEHVGELHHITSEWSIDIQIGKSQWRKIHYDFAFELTSYLLNKHFQSSIAFSFEIIA